MNLSVVSIGILTTSNVAALDLFRFGIMRDALSHAIAHHIRAIHPMSPAAWLYRRLVAPCGLL
jgi:hypothetical protein